MRDNTHRWAIQIAGAVKAAPGGLVPVLASIFLSANPLGSADAEVKSVSPNGFEVINAVTIQAPPERVYTALGQIAHWWSSAHTFSKDATNLSLDLKVGGCLCERLKEGGSVQHLLVVYAAPGQGLRLRGALGHLQMEGVDGTLAWTLKPSEAGTSVTQSYVLGGYIRTGMNDWAPKVDKDIARAVRALAALCRSKAARLKRVALSIPLVLARRLIVAQCQRKDHRYARASDHRRPSKQLCLGHPHRLP